jgi:hypothetical protein
MRELVAQPREEYPYFGVALSLLAVRSPTEAAQLLGRRLATLTEQAEEARRVLRKAYQDGVRWVFLVEEQYRLALLDAERRFVTNLIQALKDPPYQRVWHHKAPSCQKGQA